MYLRENNQVFFGNFQDRALLFRRITEDLHYFADLYYRLRTTPTPTNISSITNCSIRTSSILLLLSNIQLKDHEETVKIAAVARKFSRLNST